MTFESPWRQATREQRPRLLPLPPEEMIALQIDVSLIRRLLGRGVPFHMAGDRKQDERPRLAHAEKRLAAGETLYLVQPHEYMPRLRRMVHRLSAAAGFLGRPARTFLFRVDVPGREIMGLHDDGDMDLAWLQLAGERYVTFGTRDAKGRKQALARADGKTTGWFQGGQPAGTLLYLPPWAPHEVRCRKPSIAVSIYWEQVSPEEALVDFAGAALEASPQRALPTDAQLSRVLSKLGRAAAARAEWRALKETEDGGRDRPPAPAADWEAPATLVTPWRAMKAWAEGGRAKLAAGGEAVFTFPRDSLPALQALCHFRQVTRAQLAEKTALRPAKVSRLLELLAGEGLITAGELPAVGEFQPNKLSGWEYAVEP